MRPRHPRRLNLAIANRCFVECAGCYQFFGDHEPDLPRFARSVSRFVDLGIERATLSGGDPLTLAGLTSFLRTLRAGGVSEIKVDTVGTGLLDRSRPRGGAATVVRSRLNNLIDDADYVGIPLDSVSGNRSAAFRRGRPELLAETRAILDAFDRHERGRRVIVNTVAHRGNLAEIPQMHMEIARHPSVVCWNVFQYTPTDRVPDEVNVALSIGDLEFSELSRDVAQQPLGRADASQLRIQFESVRSRLGRYLMINSDGQAWLPDASGRTVRLGVVFGNERYVLGCWSEAVGSLEDAPTRVSQGASLREDTRVKRHL